MDFKNGNSTGLSLMAVVFPETNSAYRAHRAKRVKNTTWEIPIGLLSLREWVPYGSLVDQDNITVL